MAFLTVSLFVRLAHEADKRRQSASALRSSCAATSF
jgi:hypothetical protein